jgi:hypothetical protein
MMDGATTEIFLPHFERYQPSDRHECLPVSIFGCRVLKDYATTYKEVALTDIRTKAIKGRRIGYTLKFPETDRLTGFVLCLN